MVQGRFPPGHFQHRLLPNRTFHNHDFSQHGHMPPRSFYATRTFDIPEIYHPWYFVPGLLPSLDNSQPWTFTIPNNSQRAKIPRHGKFPREIFFIYNFSCCNFVLGMFCPPKPPLSWYASFPSLLAGAHSQAPFFRNLNSSQLVLEWYWLMFLNKVCKKFFCHNPKFCHFH